MKLYHLFINGQPTERTALFYPDEYELVQTYARLMGHDWRLAEFTMKDMVQASMAAEA